VGGEERTQGEAGFLILSLGEDLEKKMVLYDVRKGF
jgi:hypothetical protein